MNAGNLVPSFYFYKLADSLSSPYTSLTAYSAGVIDSNGNILKPESSIDPFEYLVIKLKKIIDQLPYGMTKAQLGNYMSALKMFSEEVEQHDITQEQFHCLIEGIVTDLSKNTVSYLELLEDMSVGGGGVGSLGTPMPNVAAPSAVAGRDIMLGMPIQRRKQPKYFDNCEVFEVCPEEFIQFKVAKQWNEIPDGENKNYLQRFQRRNKNAKVAIKSLNPLNGEHELHWINYPAKNFMEEVDLTILNPLLQEKVLPKEQKQYNVDNPEDVSDIFENMVMKLNPKITSTKDHAVNLEYSTRLAAGIHGLFSADKFSRVNHNGQSSHENDFLNALGNISAKQSSTADASSEGISDVIMFGKSGKISSVDTKHRYDAKSARGINFGSIPGLREKIITYFEKTNAGSIPSKEFKEHHSQIKDQLVAEVEAEKHPLGIGIYKRGTGTEFEYGFHGAIIVTPKNRKSVTEWVKSRPLSSKGSFVERSSTGQIKRFQPSVKELRSTEGVKKITGSSGSVEEHPDRLLVTDRMLKHLEKRLGKKGKHLMPVIHYHLARHGMYHPDPQHIDPVSEKSVGDREFDLDE
jgi:hypothetical protein